jgi:predicted glycosyltransferase involved in capsule biosynthesis
MAVPRRRFREIGGFDLSFLGQGGEDVDFGLRYACRFQKIKVAAAPVRHVGLTSGVTADALTGTGRFDTSLIKRRIADRFYRPGVPELVANGGEAYFEDDASWESFFDLRS